MAEPAPPDRHRETAYLNGEIAMLGRLVGVATPVNELLVRLTEELAGDRRAPGSIDEQSFVSCCPMPLRREPPLRSADQRNVWHDPEVRGGIRRFGSVARAARRWIVLASPLGC
ncbi:MAG: hypothetical protein KY460_15720 [Actinobacteria bacterium]|nr:hypothetical protein [Actinomycetota bacterium]